MSFQQRVQRFMSSRGQSFQGIELLLPILSYVQSNATTVDLSQRWRRKDGRPARLPSSLHQLASSSAKESMPDNPFLKRLEPFAMNPSLAFPTLKCIRQDPAPVANARLTIRVCNV